MPADSWIAPDDVPALAAEAIQRIDAALGRLTDADRDAFWASVRKCYNTPYNDPKPRPLPRIQAPEMAVPEPAQSQAGPDGSLGTVLSAALAAIPMPAGFAPEAHAV
ncbi:hypothetical protein [Methylobacterium goesingense]|uniref:Uncharacterized protein n=1 Tax=Methylobacterium goesingense TaxID=243690 RepID=A0ABV2KZK7_9HYPH|nr:hypothetical protein [Methylobacterium goesingense]GJD74636.1 hypothetical protein CFIICLFH_2870 [Methylobacterium goesingense]